jgi:hypothetical protein
MSAARIAASFRVSKPEALLEGALQVDLGIVAPSGNVRSWRAIEPFEPDRRLRRPARAAAGVTNGWLIRAQQFVRQFVA